MTHRSCNYFGFKDIKARWKTLKRPVNRKIEYHWRILDNKKTNKCVAEWVDIKSKPFVCLDLKPTP